jgi:hypothetical protein
MKMLKSFILFVLVAVGTSLSAGSCDILSSVPVCQVNKVYEYTTKKVPYQVCKDVCVAVKSNCNCTVKYVTKKVCTTKFKTVTVKKFKGYENVGYYHGQRVSVIWPTKLCTIPIRIENNCCTVVRTKCGCSR